MAMNQIQRRKRQCAMKVKTGCVTCKQVESHIIVRAHWLTSFRIRRIKCDEAKPSCQRCLTTGRKCDGYGSAVSIALQGAKNSTFRLTPQVSVHIPGNVQERRGFHFFLENTAVELCGYYTSSFWGNLILAASAQEPSLRHAVISIGALHEEFLQKRLNPSAPPLDNQRNEFALNQYAKAMGALRRSLSSGKQEPLTALMSCILFVCFDSLRGWFESAIVHLQSGLRILRDTRKSSSNNQIIEDNIAPLFVRLSIQSIIYIDTKSTFDRRAFANELIDVSVKDIKMSQQFENLEEARNALDQSADGLFQIFYMWDAHLPLSLQPAESLALFEQYNSQLFHWNLAFERFMSAKSKNFSSREVRGAALLKIHHTTTKIMAGARPDMDNMNTTVGRAWNFAEKFMEHLDDFSIIINLSKSMITAEEENAKSGKPPLTFSSELGLIAPLYYTCIKCPVPFMRSAALELLHRCPRREGMWNSVLVAQMIEQYWEIEERFKAVLKMDDELDEFGFPTRMTEAVDLVFKDGMGWEWKLRDPSMAPSRHSSPGFSWTDLLRDQSIFQDFHISVDFSDAAGLHRGV